MLRVVLGSNRPVPGHHAPQCSGLNSSFDDAVRGATYVFHTASPFVLKVPRGAERQLLIDPAVKGTENIIGARPVHGQSQGPGCFMAGR